MTGIVTFANAEIGSNLKVSGLSVSKVHYIGSDNFLKDSYISVSDNTTIITSNLDVTGNIFLRGDRFTVESETKLINDAIIGIANNNVLESTDIGILMQRPHANVAIVHHGDSTRFTIGYTQTNIESTHSVKDVNNTIDVHILC